MLIWEILPMVLSARTLQVIWIAGFATGMLFLTFQYNYFRQGYIPKSPEAWLFLLLGWSFVVVAAVSAGFYHKRRRSASHRTATKGQTYWNGIVQRINKPWFISLRLKQIQLHTFRHFFATMLYVKTLNILKVQQALGHKNLMNTQIYTHLINFPSDEYDVQVAETLEEAKKLLEAGFDFVTDMDGRKIFRRRK